MKWGVYSPCAILFLLLACCLPGRGEAADLTLRYVHHPVAEIEWKGLDEGGAVTSDEAVFALATNTKRGYQVIATNQSTALLNVSTNDQQKQVAPGKELTFDMNRFSKDKIRLKVDNPQTPNNSKEVVTLTIAPR